MKKIIIFSFLAFAVVSCKKDRVCTCTYTDGTIYSQTTYKNMTKKEAKTYCTSTASNITCSVK